jgi:hypothetical protein
LNAQLADQSEHHEREISALIAKNQAQVTENHQLKLNLSTAEDQVKQLKTSI